MKKKLLESLEKKTLRHIVKTLTGIPCAKMNKDKLINMLEAYSYIQIVRTLQ